MIRCYVGIMALGMTLFVLPAEASTYPNGTRANGQKVWNQAMNGKSTTVNGQGSGAGSRPKSVTGNADVVDANGNVVVSGGATVSVNGKDVPVQATGKIDKGDVANAALAALSCASGGGAVGAVVCGGVALAIPLALNWMANAGVRINPTTKELEKSDPDACTVAPCSEYTVSPNTEWYSTKALACVESAAALTANSTVWIYENGRLDGNACTYDTRRRSNGQLDGGSTVPLAVRGAEPVSSAWKRAGLSDATGLMNNSRLPTADIVGELEAAGQADKMPIKDVTVNGPASVQGPSSTTVNNTNNTTTTNTTTNNYTYNNNTVTNISNVTSSVTTRNSDGTVTNQETTTQTPGDDRDATTNPEQAEEAAPTDSALPPVPNLYERKYPNGMEGIWNDYKEQLKGTDLVSLVGKLMPTVGDGGSCPTWPINLDLAQWASYGTHDVAPPCWIWDVAKAILILSALLLARALVFGG